MKHFIMRLLYMALLTASISVYSQQMLKGTVYLDTNKNGILDRGEKGLGGVGVSNGKNVVITDKNGVYSLPVGAESSVFVIKPSGFSTPLKKGNLPDFYYHYKPNDASKEFKFKGTPATGKLPRSVNFALYPQTEAEEFQILVFGDPQPYTEHEMDYFRRGIIEEVRRNPRKAVFGISLGDLVGDDLSLHPSYIRSVEKLEMPWYNVIGNHDMNYDAKQDFLSDETFEQHFGPSTYSFNYGKVHFVILDNILYPDPRDQKGYWGGLREDQLQFIAQDLQHVPKDHQIVVAFHIHLKIEDQDNPHFRISDRDRLFELLSPFSKVLLLSAHTHKQEQIFYTRKEGWLGATPLHELNMGTTSGDWYSGTVDSTGVPLSVMRDGTYRGYSFIDFSQKGYNVDYKVAGKPDDFMVELHVPKVITRTRNSARFFANFFTGGAHDTLEYRIDQGEWKKMTREVSYDPAYVSDVLMWDTLEKLPEGRRPSNPEVSTHLWSAGFPRNLTVGDHLVEVRATDRYGKTFSNSQKFLVQELQPIP